MLAITRAMVSDSHSPDSGGSDPDSRGDSDDGSGQGFDEVALYRVIHAAVKDALLDVIGTLLLVGVAFVIVVIGAQVLLSSTTTLSIVAGAGLVGGGLYLAAATLEIIPPFRAWLN